MLTNPAFQQLLLKLVGDKEEVLVAKEIQKILKSAPWQQHAWGPPARPTPYPQRPPVCFNCGHMGHVAYTCYSPIRRGSTGRKYF